MALVAGGEGKVVREVQVLGANLLVGLGARDGDRMSSSAMGCRRRRREKRTAAFRRGIGGEGVAGDLHGGTVKLTRGSGWSEGACGGGSTADRGRRSWEWRTVVVYQR